MMVAESINGGITHDQAPYFPNTELMACRKGSLSMKAFMEYQENLYKDKSAQSDFIGNTSLWLNKADITIVDGKHIGIKKTNGHPIEIQELLGTEHIDIPDTVYGIHLPQNEILSRTKYNWFARMSPEQILNSQLMISKYILASY
jgi:hypothetical protein